ncbi:glycosyltransferase [Crassaminicella indica]|uniref:Glycosyl transferase n=1 Tax=Crassaminicella indica TaxID=2855394 RepID=A0ABX8RBB3_9CLOT|nr:glycosyltransferase [Crassaminicella indica]QXM06349.1 glycosyl transferase [Crassaminicella indica]
MLDPKKICFITCVNDEKMYEEALLYIKNLQIPENYTIETLCIKNAKSITKGYNQGMKFSNAKYKVYIHQDVFIINKKFISDFINIFEQDKNIGMLGVAGSKTIPSSGIWWEAQQTYGKVYDSHTGRLELLQFNTVANKYESVKAIDGLIMITQYDIPWREDLLDGWHFYDASQSIEFIKAGYKVAIPKQSKPWCIHDCGIVNVNNGYEKYRKIFLDEYAKELFPSYKNKKSKYNEFYNLGRKLIEKSSSIMNDFISHAKISALSKDFENAMLWAMHAGKFATFHHCGIFASKELENILIECAKNITPTKINIDFKIPEKKSSKKKILHVFSEAYNIGGHTRFIKRWIQADSKENEHAVIITLNHKTTPNWLIDSVKISDGFYCCLDQFSSSLFEKANLLRHIAYNWADIVILNTHPFDPIPTAAFGIAGGPPVIFLNHADHTFSLGLGAVDLVADIRPAGQIITLGKKGIMKSLLLPIPIEKNILPLSKAEARKKLNIPKDAIVLLSIASEYKYTPCLGYDFLEIVKDIVTHNENVMLLVVGPKDHGRWHQAKLDTNKAILSFGIQSDLNLFYACADIYLDSFSIGSLTSTLEAGFYGLPIVGFKNPHRPILTNYDISLDKADTHVKNIELYKKKIQNLIDNKALRKKRGDFISKIIYNDHYAHWHKYLNTLYSALPNSHEVFGLKDELFQLDELDFFWAYFQNIIYK